MFWNMKWKGPKIIDEIQIIIYFVVLIVINVVDKDEIDRDNWRKLLLYLRH